MKPRAVLGLDVSTTGTGVVDLPMLYGKRDDPWKGIRTACFGAKLHLCSTEDEIAARIEGIVEEVRRFMMLSRHRIVAASFEQYTFGSGAEARARQIAEVTGALKRELYILGVPIYAVHASSARKFLFGYSPTKSNTGSKAKTMVKRHLDEIGVPFTNPDERDAYVAANWLVGQLGGAAFSLPPPRGG